MVCGRSGDVVDPQPSEARTIGLLNRFGDALWRNARSFSLRSSVLSLSTMMSLSFTQVDS